MMLLIVKRCLMEVALFLTVLSYVLCYPFYLLVRQSKELSERWYSLVFFFVYRWADRPIREMKQELFAGLEGNNNNNSKQRGKGIKMLEIGPGFGGNFRYYPPSTNLTTVEINNFLEEHVDQIKVRYPNVHLVESIIANCEDMKQVPSNSYDVVVGTYILCCIHDTGAALREIHRVLAPGGKFYFLENVQHHDDTINYKLQQLYGPFWRGVTMRCKAGTFDARKLIESVGFTRIQMKEKTDVGLPAVLSHFVYGIASK